MTDSSSLANTLSEPLRQPFWWAALASVSLHGVLGVSAPTLSSILYGGNSSKNIPGSVGLVELTPAEAGRLPQTIPPRASNTRFTPFSIAPVPLRPGPKLAPPLPPAPDTINLPAMPPGMPPPGFFSPLPYPSLPPLTAPTAPPPPKTPSPTVRAPSQPIPTFVPPVPPSGFLFPPLPDNFDRNIPPPPPSPPLTEPPPFSGLDPYDPEALQRIIAQRNIPDLSDPNDIASPPYAGETNSGTARSLKLPGKSLQLKNPMIATGPGIGPSQPFDPNNRPAPGQPDSNLRGNPETMAKKIRDEYLALFNDFFRSYPDLLPVGQTFSVNNVAYPVAACSDKLEGRALFGAVVQPQGSLRAKPKMIVATGYPILDKAAIAGIESLTFPPASTHKLYQLAVDFKYDEKVCSGIPVTPTRPNPPGQQQPAPAPTAPSRPTGQPPSPAPTEVKPQFEKPPAPSNKPQPGAQPSPSAPKPAAKPSPSPEQKPAAEQSPSPQPQPAEESPQPEAAPSPAAEESPQPEAAPSPAAEESPQPEAAPSPAPEVSPSPEAAPSPAAEVSPSPAPEVSPSPEAAPSPAATEN
ncbi:MULTISPECIES: hypothetical protein [unclassified Microcoleus]|uniref:hypothetical protein n=1 Tax=unclassified Microcoleus TaxID=2642155 RepID=UPI002FCEEC86